MNDCVYVWLAFRVVWAVLLFASAGFLIFWAGYHRGRRVEAESAEE